MHTHPNATPEPNLFNRKDMCMSEMLALLDKAQTLVNSAEDSGNLDVRVAGRWFLSLSKEASPVTRKGGG